MNRKYHERCEQLAMFMIDTGATVRRTAEQFDVSKSTVHKDLTYTLRRVNPTMYCEVKKVLMKNKAERHLRGGLATKEKYARIRHKLDTKSHK